MANIISRLRTNKIIIFGTGTCAGEVLSVFRRNRLSVLAFIDFKSKKKFNRGTKVLNPAAASLLPRSKYTVVLGIHNTHVDISQIMNELKNLGYSDIVTFQKLFRCFPGQFSKQYWLSDASIYNCNVRRIEKTRQLFREKYSLDVFDGTLKYRLTLDPDVAPKPEISNQYFPKDIIKKKKGYRCIDCGAFDGDTARLMIEKGIKAEIIAFFEPDKNNYIRLSEYLAKNWKRVCKSYCIYPYGVYSKTSAMSFEAGKNAASGINKDGSATVMCVSIDDTVFGIKPDYIKMDIEGAEMEALDGAKNTIMKFRPTLVISIYHKPEHLWRIPLKIASLGLKYKYYIRSHGWNGFDLVLYAIPE